MSFEETLIHCSSLSKITTEPRNKADKDAGELSETAKTHLIEIYALEKYNFKKDISNKYTEKGNFCEPEGLSMISEFTGLTIEKNEETFFNEYFVGTPDALVEEKQIIFDNKAAWDWLTLLKNIEDGINGDYLSQMNGYLKLKGWRSGYIAHTLIDTPEHIRLAEKYALLRKMDVVSEESIDFLRVWDKKERNMIFSQYPLEERIIFFEVTLDDEYIEKAEKKVVKSRIFLEEFCEKHKNNNKKFVF
jgi:hypothetical protein